MNIVLDTNVFISGIFFSGPPFEILKAWKNSRFQIVLTKQIFEEYKRVAEALTEEFPNIDILPILELLAIHCPLISADNFNLQVCDDPDDDKFIECASASSTKIIVSGDKHLLKLSGYQGITVLKPRQFVELYIK
ncbi:MAG: putative toxin-antitoxin system toxin component, PIN family [Desulfobacteraceae bacterium]|nr:putative toxin-antitoxin system toxin component, PIN family [Desulfobacteraceae bacterium]